MPQEIPEKKKTSSDKFPNIWDKIEEISHIVESDQEITESDKQRIEQLLHEISEESKKADEKVQSYFTDQIFTKLKQLFPGNVFFDLLDQDSPHFIDSIDLLIDGIEAFQEIEKQIDKAQASIEINIFIWRNDNTGQRLAQKLLDAANDPQRPRLKIKIVKDRVGGIFEHAEENKQSFFHPDLTVNEEGQVFFVDKAYANKGETKTDEQKENPLLRQLLNHPDIAVISKESNDHSKYYIFDNTTIITGGMNIGDEYLTWHDYMAKMESPLLVKKLKARLAGNDDFDYGSSIEFSLNRWAKEAKRQRIKGPKHGPRYRRVESNVLKQREIEPKVIELLEYATENKKPVTIEMAYFGDVDITKQIIETANSGVPVSIILPEKANVQDDLNKKTIKEILDKTHGNISVYFYPGMLHAKMIHVGEIPAIIDDSTDMDEITTGITFLGSANLNTNATEDLAELNIIVDDKDCEFTKEVKKQLSQDMKKCKAYKAPPRISYNKIKSFFEAIA